MATKRNTGPDAQGKRASKDRIEAARWHFYRTIPQKHWIAMSGRQAKVLREQAERYGIPFGGAEVDLPAVVFAFHEFLARNARKLAEAAGGEDMAEAELRYKSAQASEKELAVARLREQVITRERHEQDLDAVCGAFSAIVLAAPGELASRLAGRPLGEIRKELTAWAQRAVDAAFGTPDGTHAER